MKGGSRSKIFATNHEVKEEELKKLFGSYSLRWGIETWKARGQNPHEEMRKALRNR